MDPDLVAQADRILGLTKQRAKRKRKRKPVLVPSQSSPTINVTVNLAEPKRRRAHGSTAPGRPGESIANGRSRTQRIGPSPG